MDTKPYLCHQQGNQPLLSLLIGSRLGFKLGFSGSTSLGFNSENSTSSTAAKPKSQTASHQGYIRHQDGSVQEAGKPIQSKDYKLYTVADEGRDPNPDGKTQTIDEASKGLVTENGDLSAAEQLEVLADPEYPNRNSLEELSESGGLVAITHTHGATQ